MDFMDLDSFYINGHRVVIVNKYLPDCLDLFSKGAINNDTIVVIYCTTKDTVLLNKYLYLKSLHFNIYLVASGNLTGKMRKLINRYGAYHLSEDENSKFGGNLKDNLCDMTNVLDDLRQYYNHEQMKEFLSNFVYDTVNGELIYSYKLPVLDKYDHYITMKFRQVDQVSIHFTNGGFFRIIRQDNMLCFYLDDTLLEKKKQFNYDEIINDFVDLDSYLISLCIPVGLSYGFDIERIINFNEMLKRCNYSRDKFQICILNLDKCKFPAIDGIVKKYGFDYIYVCSEEEDYFNLGYARNLYKYLASSKYVMFSDFDIYMTEEELMETLNYPNYSVVKPYRKILPSSRNDKQNYINGLDVKGNIPIPKHCYTFSGGVVMFKKSVLSKLGGYEEIRYYGYEDRAMDVKLIYHNYRVKVLDKYLVHLWHPGKDVLDENRIREIGSKIVYYYGCKFHPDSGDYIHSKCEHNYRYINSIVKLHQTENANLHTFKLRQHDTFNFKDYRYLSKTTQKKRIRARPDQ